MKEFLSVCGFAFLLAVLSPLNNCRVDVNGKKRLTGIPQLIMIILIMGVFIGLRTRCNDTGAYRHAYELTVAFPDILKDFDWSIGSNPGFVLTDSVLKAMNFSTQSFLMFYALLTVSAYIIFIKKYSPNLPMSLFLLVATGAYLFTAAAIKQTAATALALAAVTFALDGKWLRFFALLALAATFHPFVLVYFAVPFLMFKPVTKKTYILLGVTAVLALSLKYLLGAINSFAEIFTDSYTSNSFSGDGVNIFRVLVCNVPTLIMILFKDELFENSTKEENLIMNLTMMNGAIMIIGIFGTANYFARLANFFVIAQTISIPIIIQKFKDDKKIIVKAGAYVGYTLYFCYSNLILQPFSEEFEKISLFEYLSSLFLK